MRFQPPNAANMVAAMLTRGVRAFTAGAGVSAFVLVSAMVFSGATLDLTGLPAMVAVALGIATAVASWKLEQRR